MPRTIISYFPKEEKIKVLEPSGTELILTKEELENSLVAGHEYTIQLKKEYTFSNKTYNKIKDRLWSFKKI